LSNVYLTDAPIELVCYTGRTAVPDDFSPEHAPWHDGQPGNSPISPHLVLGRGDLRGCL